MIQRDLKYWPSGNRVIRFPFRVFALIIFIPMLGFAQNNDMVKRATYHLIEDIIAKDTVVDRVTKAVLENGVKTGRYSKEDSIKVVAIRKSRKLRLFKNTANASLKGELQREMKEKHNRLIKYLGEDNLEGILESIPEDGLHDLSYVPSSIEVVEQSGFNVFSHFFSAPVLVGENTYLMYHFNHDNSLGGIAHFILFSIEASGDYKIEGYYPLWFS